MAFFKKCSYKVLIWTFFLERPPNLPPSSRFIHTFLFQSDLPMSWRSLRISWCWHFTGQLSVEREVFTENRPVTCQNQSGLRTDQWFLRYFPNDLSTSGRLCKKNPLSTENWPVTCRHQTDQQLLWNWQVWSTQKGVDIILHVGGICSSSIHTL